MKSIIGLFLIFLISCQGRQETRVIAGNSKHEHVEEYFADSLNVGRKSNNKIELSLFRMDDSIFVVINFYSKQNEKWVLKNKYEFGKDGITRLDTKLSDFNNDGLNDMTYISAVAARGANEVRRLFIYDKDNDQLTLMKNSENYPNMLYNKELDCIDAFLVYGGCSTVFLKISGDSLKEFASVELFDGLYVRTYDELGKEKFIYEDTSYKGHYERYKNYNPLKEYEELDFK